MTKAEESKAIINAQMKGGKAAVLKLKAKWRKEAAEKRKAIQSGKKPSTSRGSSADTAVSRTKENIDKGRTAALNTLITAVPGGFIVKAGRVAGKIFKTRAAARNAAKQLKAPTPKLPAPKPKAPPVRSSKTTPNTLSAATQAKKRLTSTPNTSTPKPPVRQSRTPSPAMDAERKRAAAERKAMEAKRQKAVSQSQTAKEAAQGLRKTPNTSTPKPPVRQSRTGSPAMNAQRKRAAADLAAKTKRQKAVNKIKKQKADKPSVGSIVGAGSKQSPRPPAKKPTPPAVVAKPPAVVAKPPATRTATSPRPKTERPKPPPPKGSKSSPRPRNRRPNPLAAVPLAVTGTPKPKPPKKRAKDEVFDTDLVASRKPSSVSAGIDTDDFSEERDSYKGLYDKKKEDPHWREIKKVTKALGGLKYMVPKVDEHGDELPPEMRDVSGGYTGGQVKKLKKKTASKPKRKTSSTKKRKGFSGRGQGAALRGF